MTLPEVLTFGLEAIEGIVATIKDAHSGKITPEQAFARIAVARAAKQAHDAASARVDERLEKKFAEEDDEGGSKR